jgi:5S rRNA maturation endonuclease (ribonuclease M5)
MTYTRKTDLNHLTETVFKDINILLDSFDLEYKQVNENKICMSCPIHGGDNETGLAILTNRNLWACWTHNCHEQYSKNIFGFVQGLLTTKNGKDASFKDALKYITSLYKIDAKYVKIKRADNSDFENIVKTFEQKEDRILEQIESIDLKIPSEYFLKRGFLPETLVYFGVGETKKNKNRAMIPIYEKTGVLAGYIGRATKPYVLPKFLFSEGLNKTEHLYNYNNALQYIKKHNAIILVEGQGDVWRLFETGVYNAVGCFGKDLSLKQIELLLETGVTNLIVLLDDDEAGREAKFKIQRSLHKLFNIKFPYLSKKDTGQLKIEEVKTQILPQIKGYY